MNNTKILQALLINATMLTEESEVVWAGSGFDEEEDKVQIKMHA